MYYAKPNSLRVHANPTCRRSRVHDARLVDFVGNMRKCKFCFPPLAAKCFICDDESKELMNCKCSDHHSICPECVDAHIQANCLHSSWDGNVFCPCMKGHSNIVVSKTLQRKISEIMSSLQKKEVGQYAQCCIDFAQQNILTMKCQNCNNAFYDFDGCLALMCRCKASICALCLESFKTNDECHKHVLKCKWNCDFAWFMRGQVWKPRLDYFMTEEEFQRRKHNRICFQLWFYVFSVFMKTRSFLFALGVASRLNQNDSSMWHSNFLQMFRFVWHTFKYFVSVYIFLSACDVFIQKRFFSTEIASV